MDDDKNRDTAASDEDDMSAVHELFDPAVAASIPPANTLLTYRGGPIMQSPKIVCIFWGQAWRDTADEPVMRAVESFFREELVGSVMADLQQYNVNGMVIGQGSLIHTMVLNTPCPGVLTDADIQTTLEDLMVSGRIPAPDINTAYFVYPQYGVQIEALGGRSCENFCGYHNRSRIHNIRYAVLVFPACDGCLGGLEKIAALTSTSSHELAEAITDPVPPTGWYNDQQGEIGDICAWKTRDDNGIVVQQLWSNAAGACV